MTRLQELYRQLEEVMDRQPTGSASATLRHHQVADLRREIDYYELGDMIPRAYIQQEVAEINALQEEIDRLSALQAEKKRNLMNTVFGEHVKL
ncbi:hypothetical protein MHZ92_11670 [Sporosarcina sp. ACRSL]|uniref:hypothetical protein n=1 Tax=Sporosarcina sp. ACRSL TaxID=2918215 RepID=UPI001EF4CA43|nr:hypothetical protein [Sporosarcina sp. ACRSL]MCG7344795.1 hypothetical protein [Sporosarcina sp. ACRSL]